MIVTNANGLTKDEADKALRPYARNTGKPHHPRDAAKMTAEFLEGHPGLLEEAGSLLDKAQK